MENIKYMCIYSIFYIYLTASKFCNRNQSIFNFYWFKFTCIQVWLEKNMLYAS